MRTKSSRHVLLLAALLCIASAVGAQLASGQSLLTGHLTADDSPEPVAFANVLLLHASDSVLAKAELSGDDGSFTITADTGRYFLQVVMLGYDDYASAPFSLTGDLDIGTLTLAAFAKTLETAVVTARKPFLEQQAGKMIVNVEGSITGQTGSATQLLQKVPGVVIQQGQVSLAGASNLSILIDGKPTRYMDVDALLRDLPAADISRVEVITQPGAAYEAQGGAVLNVVLKKNVRLGTNGSLSAGVGRGNYDVTRTNVNAQVSHRAGPLNLFGSAGYRRGSGFDRLLLTSAAAGGVVVQDNLEPSLPNTTSLRGGLDYDLDDRQTVGLSGRYAHTLDEATGPNSSQGYAGIQLGDPLSDGQQLFNLATRNVNNQRRISLGLDGYYRFAIDGAGRELAVDLSYASFEREGDLRTTTRVLSGDFGSPIAEIRNAERGATRVGAAQLDFTQPFGEAIEVRSGVKYSLADVDADLRATSRPMNSEEVFTNAPGLTNRFLYDEHIAAGYVAADAELGEVRLNAGLRYEHTFVDGENVTSDSSFARDYGGVFPSFGVSLPLAGSLGATAAYSYRIDRPNYRSLNPFVRYLDPLTIQRGNTQLQPAYVHNAEVGLTFDGQPFAKLGFSRTRDAISLVTEQNAGTGATEAYDANLDVFTSYGGQLFAPLSFIPQVEGYLGGMAYYKRYESDFLDAGFDQSGWELTGFANATVSLPLKLKAEASFWLQSGGQRGIIQNGTAYGASFGLERKLLDEQLTVGVNWQDAIFDPWEGRIRYLDQQIDIVNTWETGIVMLNLSYRFGNRYLKGKERRDSAARDVLDRAN